MTMHDPKPLENLPRAAQKRIKNFASERNAPKRGRKLGETLVNMGRMAPEAIDAVVDLQEKTSAHFGQAAKKLGFVSQEDVATALAVQHGLLREDIQERPVPADLVVVRRPASAAAENFRKMRTRLLTTRKRKQLRSFAVVSCHSTFDADYVTINLASSLAQLGRRTLLIDADLRRTRMEDLFSAPKGAPGLSEILSGGAEFAEARTESVVKNLSLLTSGGRAHSPQELLANGRFKRLLLEARATFDHVVIASAPFGDVADGELAWTSARSVFVVARRDHDRLKQLQELSDVLRQLETDVIGSVLIR